MATALPKEHDIVALLVDLPDHHLSAGDTGAVVHCYRQAEAFEVEFLDASGKPKAVVTLKANQILKLNWSPVAAS
jgi:hypothetical protein